VRGWGEGKGGWSGGGWVLNGGEGGWSGRGWVLNKGAARYQALQEEYMR
jgi:hypothetical protein